MNQQLSRAEKYGHRRRKEGKETKPSKAQAKKADDHKSSSIWNTSIYYIKSWNKQQTVPELSRMQRKRQAEQKQKQRQKQTKGIQEAETLPTRAELFPSRRVRLSKWFINSLIFIFILLTGFLVYWGIIGAPPLNTLLP